jgi:MFS transporter, FHS family, L-fucose permease
MAIVGGAILPPLSGLIISAIGYQKMMVLVVIPYSYIFSYGFRGYQVKNAPVT